MGDRVVRNVSGPNCGCAPWSESGLILSVVPVNLRQVGGGMDSDTNLGTI